MNRCKITLSILVLLPCVACKSLASETKGFGANNTTPNHLDIKTSKDVPVCQPPGLNYFVLYLDKDNGTKDEILRWSPTKREDIENIATLNPNGKIQLTISGLYQFSLLLTIDSYVDWSECLQGKNLSRIQIDCFKNDISLFYLTSVVHKNELRSLAFPVLPIRMEKGDEIYIRVNEPLCIYPQGQTGVLTMTWMSC